MRFSNTDQSQLPHNVHIHTFSMFSVRRSSTVVGQDDETIETKYLV